MRHHHKTEHLIRMYLILYLCVSLIEQIQECFNSLTKSDTGTLSCFLSLRTDLSVRDQQTLTEEVSELWVFRREVCS